jgi:hypothetical protein
MAGMPPIPMDPGALETGETETPSEDAAENYTEEVDPQFAADCEQAFPDFSDEQCAALQRAILGLIGRG